MNINEEILQTLNLILNYHKKLVQLELNDINDTNQIPLKRIKRNKILKRLF